MNKVKKYKVCRRLGSEVYDKCQTQKFALSEARHTKNAKRKRRKTISNFGAQLLEKQKVRFTYGISERQFRNYVREAVARAGDGPAVLFQLLENRLDSIVYRLGIASTRPLARQMVSHGHFTVNGKRVTIPSFQVRSGDQIAIREGSRGKKLFANLEKRLQDYTPPAWLTFDNTALEGTVTAQPVKSDDAFDFTSIIEFYSR